MRALERAADLLVSRRFASAAAWVFMSPEGRHQGGAGLDSSSCPADASTSFEAGSLTKVFTALLLADAVTRSEIHLDDPITMALPEAADLLPLGWDLTWKQLATHTSGLPRLPYGFSLLRKVSSNPYAGFDAESLRRSLQRAPRIRPEPRRFLYSNFGFGLLGYLLARLHRRPLTELFQERIIAPMALSNMGTGHPAGGSVARGRSRFGLPARRWSFEEAMAGAGGLSATAGSLAAFLDWNLRAAGGDETPLARALRLAQEVQIRGQGDSLGLGWQIAVRNGRAIHCHDGGTGGFSGFIGFCAENGEAMAFLAAGAGLAPNLTALGLGLLQGAAEGTLRS